MVDYVEKIDSLETGYDVFRYLKDIANDFGAQRFSVMNVSSSSSALSNVGMVNNWDPELIHVYDEQNLGENSPVLSHFKTGNRPLTFAVDTLKQQRSDKEKALTVGLFHDFNMKRSIGCPTSSTKSTRGGIAFSSNELELSAEDECVLQLVSNYTFDRLETVSLGKSELKSDISLSQRETDCLSWTAAGKTSRDIADILELSDHTVTHYLTSACKKLDAVNRVQAVAKAMRLGLLS